MIEYVKVTNHLGESITLTLKSPEQSGFFVRDVQGIGPGKANINMSESLYLDGAYYNSAKVAARNIVLDLGVYDGQDSDIELSRQQTYRFFPIKKKVTVEIKTKHRLGKTTGYVESNTPNIFSRSQNVPISILCEGAYFTGGDPIQTVFSGISSGFEFPFENASLTEKLLEFGNVFINQESNVFYSGDVPTGVVIYATMLGAVNNLTINNIITGQAMALISSKITALTGSNLTAGDTVIISTVPGRKYIRLIRNGVIYNILNALSSTSSWFLLERGDNVFKYIADSGVGNIQFSIEHQLLYEGL